MIAAALPFPDVGPDIFSISIGSFNFALRWYAMAYIVGILIAWWLMARAVRRDDIWASGAPATKEQIDDLITWIILGVILGGRLGYVLFYDPARFLAEPAAIVRVWEGGMAFHGGLLGVVIAIILFSWRNNPP